MQGFRPAAIAACALVLAGPAAAAGFAHGFDADAQGWTAESGGDLAYAASGGNPDGFLRVADVSLVDFVVVAPASVLGDWSAYLGWTLAFDARNVNDFSANWPAFGEVRLSAPGGNVAFDVAAAGEPPPDGAWHHYAVALTSANFGSALPAVLAQVDRLTIMGEFHTPDGEVLGFDNIALVPKPATFALMALGALAVGAAARRR